MITTTERIHQLHAEIRRLRARLATTLTDLRNLVAAAKATLNAHADGEQDALYYLRDELQAQGHLPQEREREPYHGERP
ncbi:MAG: hypothetical protein J2P25_01175 [Nocardiopsaceae bacterium]|nr:hypothetical protein [Nocardiopsaceae bacterium]